ncbi:MAG: acyl-CoA synthetase [Alphaproteobacteria bacterium]
MAKTQLKGKGGGGGGGGGGAQKLLLLMFAAPLLFMLLPTLILLFFAMLPTSAAYMVERGPVRYGWICVGGLNFAGTAPYLLNLWFKGQNIENVFKILGDMLTLIIIYGASAFGWLLFVAVPPVVGVFMSLNAGRRVAKLRATQRRLVDTWGPEVAQTEDASIDLISNGAFGDD